MIVFSVLVLTEDGAVDAHETLVALLKKAFRLVEPACATHRIRFDPQGEAERRYLVGNAWKGDGPRSRVQRGRERFRLVDLYQTIATRLLEEAPRGFVVVHVDGDRPWSQREHSENVAKYEARVVDGVRAILHAEKPDQVEQGLARLVRLVPFYSIEAWLYQNLSVARVLCAALDNPRELVAQLDAWTEDRAGLDEVEQIKDRCRLGDRHNLSLATEAWPAEAAYEARRSFHAAVERLRASDELRDALARCTPG